MGIQHNPVSIVAVFFITGGIAMFKKTLFDSFGASIVQNVSVMSWWNRWLVYNVIMAIRLPCAAFVPGFSMLSAVMIEEIEDPNLKFPGQTSLLTLSAGVIPSLIPFFLDTFLRPVVGINFAFSTAMHAILQSWFMGKWVLAGMQSIFESGQDKQSALAAVVYGHVLPASGTVAGLMQRAYLPNVFDLVITAQFGIFDDVLLQFIPMVFHHPTVATQGLGIVLVLAQMWKLFRTGDKAKYASEMGCTIIMILATMLVARFSP